MGVQGGLFVPLKRRLPPSGVSKKHTALKFNDLDGALSQGR